MGAFDNQASSLRFTGAPDDWKYDTLNLYFNDYFIGDEEFTYNDMTQLNYDNRAKSIVVTGCSSWTVYQQVHTRPLPHLGLSGQPRVRHLQRQERLLRQGESLPYELHGRHGERKQRRQWSYRTFHPELN